MTRKHNRSCIYTGAVGARLRVPVRKPSRRISKIKWCLKGGPLNGHEIWLDADSQASTFELAPMHGWPAGRYSRGYWVHSSNLDLT